VELTDIVASLVATAAIVLMLRVWQPSEPLLGEGDTGRFTRPAVAGSSTHSPSMEAEVRRRDDTVKDPPGDVVRAYMPYLVIIAIFSIVQIPAVKDALAESPWTTTFQWPGLDVVSPEGEPLTSLTFTFNWLPAAGTLLLISGLITMAILRVSANRAIKVLGATLDQLKWAILTVAAVLGLAYVMNQSGQIITLGLWAAGAGDFFAFLSSIIGWLGVAVTGSDTSSNALFGALQVTAANEAGMSPTLLAAANSSGRGAGQDDLAPEPRHRRCGRGPGGPGGRPVP
jgi:lactate permease